MPVPVPVSVSVLLEPKQILTHIEQSDDIAWKKVFDHASMMGDLNALKLLSIQIQRPAMQVSCFEQACEYGHRHIINFFFDYLKQFQFSPETYDNFIRLFCTRGFLSASRGGRLDIIQMLVDIYQPGVYDLIVGWRSACYKCSWDVIFFLKEKFPIIPIRGLYQTCKGKHRKLVDWLVENGDNDWDAGFAGACESGDVPLIQFMIERGATNKTEGFQLACMYGHVEAFKYLLETFRQLLSPSDMFFYSTIQIKKLLMEYDVARSVPIRVFDICPLLNEGISIQTLLLYQRSHAAITYVVGLAERLLQVVQLSLHTTLCSDLVNDLKGFVGYDVNPLILESIE